MPPEIRQIIWTYALGNRQLRIDGLNQKILNFTRRPQQNEIEFSSEEGDYFSWKDITLNLLLANRQIRAEAQPVFYATNLFTFASNFSLHEWLAILTDEQMSWVKAIGFFCHWPTAVVFLSEIIESAILPQTIKSVYVFRETAEFEEAKGLKKAQINIINDLNQTMCMILRSGLKVKDISLALCLKVYQMREESVAKDSDKWELVRRSLVYSRDKALEYLDSDPANHASSNPYQWLAGEASAEWLHQPQGVGLENFLLSLSEDDSQVPTDNPEGDRS